MKKNKKDISIELLEFFPKSKSTKINTFIKRSRWPLMIGLAFAAVVAVGLVIGSGGLAVPHAAFLGSFKSALATWTKRLVITVGSLAGFALGVGLAKKLGLDKEKPLPDYVLEMERSYYQTLTQPVPISNVRKSYVTQYCQNEQKVFISNNGRECSYPIDREKLFLPLRNSIHFQDKNKPAKVTHYREEDDSLLIYYPTLRHECVISRSQMDGISRPSMV